MESSTIRASHVAFESAEQATALRGFLADTGYTNAAVRKIFGGRIVPPVKDRRNLPLMLHQTREENPLNVLVRWFVLGVPVDEERALTFIAEPMIDLMVSVGMLIRREDRIVPAIMILPTGSTLTASDFVPGADPPRDIVLGPITSGRLLANFIIRRKYGTALDLCCGGGIHSIALAEHCESVTGTDLNERALMFAEFNALLNGVRIEFLGGDSFQPVEGRHFDLIVSNPPFFLLPSNDLLYSGNPMELDRFVCMLVRDAPRYLNEGGTFQMVLEWVEIEGEPWRQRLTNWVSDLDCDVLILKNMTTTPADYADAKLRSLGQRSPEDDITTLNQWIDYYRDKRVIAMHAGLIALRKRTGAKNWIEIDDPGINLGHAFGDIVEQTFQDHDLVHSGSDEELLELRPRLSPHLELQQVFETSDNGWKQPSISLKIDRGLVRSCGIDLAIGQFLSHFDGKKTLDELIGSLTPVEGSDEVQTRAGALAVVRQFLQRGFVLPR